LTPAKIRARASTRITSTLLDGLMVAFLLIVGLNGATRVGYPKESADVF